MTLEQAVEIFEWAGGADWYADLILGLVTVAVAAVMIALAAIAASRSR